jgi:hypothetical protein
MAAYPDIGLQFDVQHINGPQSDLSEAGTFRTLDLTTQDAYRVRIVHPLVSATDRDTLEAFYTANKGSDNTITLGGKDYTLKYERGYSIRSISATYFELATTMIGSRA